MPSRFVALVLVALVGWTAELGATLIVTFRSGDEIVIAADSLRTINTAQPQQVLACKIRNFGDVVFAATGRSSLLERKAGVQSLEGHPVCWLEYALVNRAAQTKRCHLDNGNAPQEPAMTEAEKADTQGFLKEILQILPLVGLRVFEFAKPIATPTATTADTPLKPHSNKPDTVIVPAQKEGFEKVFLGEDCWYSIRISGGMLDKIRYIAAYQSQMVSAITHYAPVDRIEPYGESGKYKLIFSEKAQTLGPIPYEGVPPGAMQGPRYTTFEKLKAAKKLSDLFGKTESSDP